MRLATLFIRYLPPATNGKPTCLDLALRTYPPPLYLPQTPYVPSSVVLNSTHPNSSGHTMDLFLLHICRPVRSIRRETFPRSRPIHKLPPSNPLHHLHPQQQQQRSNTPASAKADPTPHHETYQQQAYHCPHVPSVLLSKLNLTAESSMKSFVDNFPIAGCMERLLAMDSELTLPIRLLLTLGTSIASTTSTLNTTRGFSFGSKTAEAPHRLV